ncbi:P-II family nitrogen regulator [Desulfobulbus elongatus]|uniref:P-II family nitrogen regulator n=1 Tax=Desulfobulbus elongatus TaxID=53332 RepID=UPI000487EBE5|nr:P-II family nitrogen regulator [Desulfobulbus elongatus]
MKEIIAIIRPKKVGPTKKALAEMGFPSMTAMAVLGRGKQRGIAGEIACDVPVSLQAQARSGGMKYVPKRLLSLVVANEDVEAVIATIVKVNQTAQIGDGRIFICPIDNALRVRTDETGESAIK